MTPNINLRPWRDEKRKNSRKIFLIIWIITALISLTIAIIIPISLSGRAQFINAQITELQSHFSILEQKINILDRLEKQIAKKQSRLQKMEQLLESRYSAVYLFNALSHSVPKKIQVDTISLKGFTISIEGNTKKITLINQFLKSMNQQDHITQAKLHEIINKNGSTHFVIGAEINPMKERREGNHE
jgi:type IV pilus assembly protein PilN